MNKICLIENSFLPNVSDGVRIYCHKSTLLVAQNSNSAFRWKTTLFLPLERWCDGRSVCKALQWFTNVCSERAKHVCLKVCVCVFVCTVFSSLDSLTHPGAPLGTWANLQVSCRFGVCQHCWVFLLALESDWICQNTKLGSVSNANPIECCSTAERILVQRRDKVHLLSNSCFLGQHEEHNGAHDVQNRFFSHVDLENFLHFQKFEILRDPPFLGVTQHLLHSWTKWTHSAT